MVIHKSAKNVVNRSAKKGWLTVIQMISENLSSSTLSSVFCGKSYRSYNIIIVPHI